MAITNGYTTLAIMRTELNIGATDTDSDAQIERAVNAVSREIDKYTGRRFYAVTETRYFTPPLRQGSKPTNYSKVLYFDQDLISVTTWTNGTYGTVAASAYNLLPYNTSPKYGLELLDVSSIGWYPDTNSSYYRSQAIAGSWGYAATAPDDVAQACIIQSVRLFKRKDNPYGVAGSAQMGQLIQIAKLDPDVELLLQAYRRIVTV